jgi:hypothetical protein
MTSWRNSFHRHIGPGLLPGITIGTWLRVLRENRFAIDRGLLPRAVVITGCSFVNTPFAWYETFRFGSAVKRTKVPPPVFVIGHFRSGTTFLHNLLAVDPQFAFPNTYQARFGDTFLSTEALLSWFVKLLLPRQRPQDNMTLAIRAPQEDEFAMCAMIGVSPYMSYIFPRRAHHYDRHLTMRNVSDGERRRWRSAVTLFFKKLTYRYDRTLLLKSPPHTGRLSELLDLWPGARFIHVHRNPYAVFKSTRNLFSTAMRWSGLQQPEEETLDDRILEQYRAMHEAFFDERDRIPSGQFCDVEFETLERDPVGQVQRIYDQLNLAGFSSTEDLLRKYLDSLGDYRKSTYPDLEPGLKKRIAAAWSRCFAEWGYDV